MLFKKSGSGNSFSRAVFFRSKGLYMSEIPTPLSYSRFLSEKEVADILGISIKTTQAWRLKSIGPRYWRLNGKLVRYLWQDIIDYLEGTAVTPSQSIHRAFSPELVNKFRAESHDSAQA